MDGAGRHDELKQSPTLRVALQTVAPDVKLLRRPSWFDLGVDFAEELLESV